MLRGVREEAYGTGALRNFDQILLRGEHVILLALLPAVQPTKRQERDRDIPPGKREKLDKREGEIT